MKLATTATVGSNHIARTSRARERTPDVNRWVAMLDEELRAEDAPLEGDPNAVEVTFEFGRSTLDPATPVLKAGDSLRLDQLADEPLDVLAAGRPVARGELVVVEGQLGLRIVELLTLLIAWLAIGVPASFAEERPRENSASTLFDDDPPDLWKTPFSPVRSNRSNSEESVLSDDVRLKNSSRTSSTSRKSAQEPLSTPLTPRSAKPDPDRGNSSPSRSSWTATVLPLLFVVGLIVVGARLLKSRSPNTVRGLPSEAFEVLGRKAIDARTSVVLARSGTRLLLLSLSPHGLQTLTEISDPVEVDCLAGLCRVTQRDQSLVEIFRSMLHKPAGANPSLRSPISQPSTAPSLEERLAARQTLGVPASTSLEVRS